MKAVPDGMSAFSCLVSGSPVDQLSVVGHMRVLPEVLTTSLGMALASDDPMLLLCDAVRPLPGVVMAWCDGARAALKVCTDAGAGAGAAAVDAGGGGGAAAAVDAAGGGGAAAAHCCELWMSCRCGDPAAGEGGCQIPHEFGLTAYCHVHLPVSTVVCFCHSLPQCKTACHCTDLDARALA